MPFFHIAHHSDGRDIDPAEFLRDDPNLYRWALIYADCKNCGATLDAFISRPHNKIHAIRCPKCQPETH